MPDGKRDWNEEGREASLTRNGSEKLLVRVDTGATELEDCRACLASAALHGRFQEIVEKPANSGLLQNVWRTELVTK